MEPPVHHTDEANIPAVVDVAPTTDIDKNLPPPSASKTIGPFPLAPSQVDQVVKRATPQGYQVSKDAKAAINKSANVFLLFMEALISSEKVSALHTGKRQQPPKRVTISAADVKNALQDAGMAHLLPLMSANKRSR
ncbi:Hypothetical protein, putative [Bodo saltans]|uniref:Transcription factor CBF/NF-Y/archaeal histone domain-containing protein n=1 Tax=Bodo saltans TaxID=75058 RepID=A0A0S4KIL7_BODSA|nr:Hypothetical protein, putative [Bodo saltans]|eukprot:CUI14141.1 Hypothetical protein, putative [Bodo saltans]